MMETQFKTPKLSPVLAKTLLVTIVNIVVLAAIFILLPQVKQRAKEVKDYNQKLLLADQTVDTAILNTQIEKEKSEITKLKSVFDNDNTVILFVQNIDALKQNGVVTSFEFPVSNLITDKLGGKGLPITIELHGSKDQVNEALINISKFPVLVRPITLSIIVNDDTTIDVKYGGFLYVN